MAGLAEGDQIAQPVRLAPVIELAKGADVVDFKSPLAAGCFATRASVPVPPSCNTCLESPIWSVVGEVASSPRGVPCRVMANPRVPARGRTEAMTSARPVFAGLRKSRSAAFANGCKDAAFPARVSSASRRRREFRTADVLNVLFGERLADANRTNEVSLIAVPTPPKGASRRESTSKRLPAFLAINMRILRPAPVGARLRAVGAWLRRNARKELVTDGAPTFHPFILLSGGIGG